MSCLNVGVGSATCGPCPKGYEGDGRNCSDIDEVSRGDLLGEINFSRLAQILWTAARNV